MPRDSIASRKPLRVIVIRSSGSSTQNMSQLWPPLSLGRGGSMHAGSVAKRAK